MGGRFNCQARSCFSLTMKLHQPGSKHDRRETASQPEANLARSACYIPANHQNGKEEYDNRKYYNDHFPAPTPIETASQDMARTCHIVSQMGHRFSDSRNFTLIVSCALLSLETTMIRVDTVIENIRQLWTEEQGQDIAEYAVMLAV